MNVRTSQTAQTTSHPPALPALLLVLLPLLNADSEKLGVKVMHQHEENIRTLALRKSLLQPLL